MLNSPLLLLFSDPIAGLVFFLSVAAAITVHEFAHAWTAWKLGDDTPLLDDRVNLNPASHIDPIGALLFAVAGFGYGRPVIYNPMRLHRKVDELLVALAGPASNVIFGVAAALLITAQASSELSLINPDFLQITIIVNVSLAAFNMLPIPPLDGSSIVAYFWPEYRSLMGGQIGLAILLLLMFSGMLSVILSPLFSFFLAIVTLFGAIG